MLRVVIALLAASAAVPAIAETPLALTTSLTGGTLGIGPEITAQVSRVLALRASATFLGMNIHGHAGDTRYTEHMQAANWGGTIDVMPFGSGFRLSAGARATANNHLDVTKGARSGYTVYGFQITPEMIGTVNYRIHTRNVSPVATVGWSHDYGPHLNVGMDAGVMFQGHPNICDVRTTGLMSNPLLSDSVHQMVAQSESKVHGFAHYPVLQMSMGWRF